VTYNLGVSLGRRAVAVLLAALMLGAAWDPAFAQEKKKKKRGRAMLVVADKVIKEPMTQTFPVIGRLVARRAGVVAARTQGPVAKMMVDVGDRVKKGDLIASLVTDSIVWKKRLKQAVVKEKKAAVTTANAQIGLIKQELKRLKNLRRSAAFSQARFEDKRQEVVKAESAAAEASANLQRARADLKLTEISLYNAQVRAPFGGVVSKRYTDSGAFLNVGQPVVDLIDDNSLEIEADVPSNRIGGLTPGTPIKGQIDFKHSVPAKVRAMVPEENPLTRTRTVRFTAEFDGSIKNLAASQSITILIPIGQTRTVVSVHKDAVITRKGQKIVFVVVKNKEGKGQKAFPRTVTLGEAVGGRFEVLSGLKPGERVVVRGNERLRPGQKVKISKTS
jgi:RND family efflux transporter MFP subunit